MSPRLKSSCRPLFVEGFSERTSLGERKRERGRRERGEKGERKREKENVVGEAEEVEDRGKESESIE